MFLHEFFEIFESIFLRELLRTTISIKYIFQQFSEGKKSEGSWIFVVIRFPLFYSCILGIPCGSVLPRASAVANTTSIFFNKEKIEKKIFESKFVNIFLNLYLLSWALLLFFLFFVLFFVIVAKSWFHLG